MVTPEPSRRLNSVLTTASCVAAAAVVAMGAMVLVGWALDVEFLKSFLHPNRVAMNPLTAVCFILTGTALWLSRRGEPWPDATGQYGTGNGTGNGNGGAASPAASAAPAPARTLWAAAILAGLVAAAAMVKLSDFLPNGGADLRIDRLLFRARSVDNDMAPDTAVAFVLVALSMLTLDARNPRLRWLSTAFVLSAASVALLALTGYLYNVLSFNHARGYIPMALNTALSFLVLCGGVLCARPAREPLVTLLSPTAGGVVARRLLPAALVIPLVVGLLTLLGERRGFYFSDYGLTLFTLANVLIFVGLIWWNATFLHRLDQQRLRTEEVLREAEAVYHSLVETLPQNIFRKDLDGKVTFGNSNYCKVLGMSQDQLLGKTDFDLFPHHLAERYRKDDHWVIENRKVFDTVEEHVTPSGKRLYVQVMKTPVYGPGDRVVGVQGIFWDVTERKLAEQELERKNKLLEEAVASEREALAELKKTQTHLVQQEKLASLGQMVAGVAHEINNPLSFVINNTVVLQRDLRAVTELLGLYRKTDACLSRECPDVMNEVKALSEQVDVDYTLGNLPELLGRSREGLKRIQQIVRDLRDFARLDESDLHEVDLNAGVQSTVNIIQGHARRKQVLIHTELDPSLPPVACQPAKINQVIMNLIHNAIDASKENGKVVVRTSAVDGEARIEVADEGHGIPPEIRDRIFDPFFTTKPLGEGTGLGLSISYGIVNDHGGTIDVASTLGVGSTFTIHLPLRELKARPPIAAEPTVTNN
ncbi:MAG TPA: ATP-binding protein [Tepidisphaeraceae bacterium]|nr:ATP-binding protein [Tepidisphaeraceae bacterium]